MCRHRGNELRRRYPSVRRSHRDRVHAHAADRGLPDFVRPFAAGGLKLVETVDWGPADADGNRLGEVTLAFTSQPLSMRGQLDMKGDGVGTTAILDARLIANVALFGGRIEKACEPLVHKALPAEETLGRTWLANGA